MVILSDESSRLGARLAETLGVPVVTDPALIESSPVLGAGYRRKVPASVLARVKIANVHTGFLPWNRGSYPNVWPLLDNTPAGVTLHWMDEGLDTGPIIAQSRVPTYPWDTAGTLYDRLQDAAVHLACAHLGDVLLGTPGTPQPEGGSAHTTKELESYVLDGDQVTTVQDVITTLQARTCGDYGCPIRLGSQTLHAQIRLSPWS